jgi:hypothetical protein
VNNLNHPIGVKKIILMMISPQFNGGEGEWQKNNIATCLNSYFKKKR